MRPTNRPAFANRPLELIAIMLDKMKLDDRLALISAYPDTLESISTGQNPVACDTPSATRSSHDGPMLAEYITFDPADAQAFLNDHYLGGVQREIRRSHIAFLVQEMKSEDLRWKPYSVMQCACLPDGTIYLVNGYHRLTAQVKSNTTQTYVMLYLQVEDKKEVVEMYGTIDTGLPRRFKDIAQGMFDPNIALISAEQRAKVAASMSVLLEGFAGNSTRTKVKIPLDVRAHLTELHAKPAAAYYKAINQTENGALRRRLQSAAVLAFGLMTFERAPQIAAKFWTAIAKDEAEERSAPESRASEFLLKSRVDQLANNRVPCRALAICWNAFVDGELVKTKIVGDALTADKSPLYVKNTLFDGATEVEMTIDGDWVSTTPNAPAVPEVVVNKKAAAENGAAENGTAPVAAKAAPVAEQTVAEPAAVPAAMDGSASEVEAHITNAEAPEADDQAWMSETPDDDDDLINAEPPVLATAGDVDDGPFSE